MIIGVLHCMYFRLARELRVCDRKRSNLFIHRCLKTAVPHLLPAALAAVVQINLHVATFVRSIPKHSEGPGHSIDGNAGHRSASNRVYSRSKTAIEVLGPTQA